MREFIIRLRHDRGEVTIRTWAETKQKAIEHVLEYECAPESAIIFAKDV